VKGVLLAPSAIEEVVRSFEELGDEYEVTVVKRGDLDDISLKVEPASGFDLSGERLDGFLRSFKDQLRLKTNLGYKVEVVEAGSLPRYALKAKRFKDLRKVNGA